MNEQPQSSVPGAGAPLENATPAIVDEHNLTEASCSLPLSDRLGCETVRFDLSCLYKGDDDPQLITDLTTLESMFSAFDQNFRGKLATELGPAMQAWEEISRLSSKLVGYVHLRRACEVDNQELQRLNAQIDERLSTANAEHFVFFSIELGKLPEETVTALVQNDPRVAKYSPLIKQIRELAKHNLSLEVERALELRSPYLDSEWIDYLEERQAQQRFSMNSAIFAGEEFENKQLSLEQIIEVISEHPRREVRAEALRIFNKGLEQEIVPLMGRVLNLTSGLKNVEDSERRFAHIMAARNLNNQVSDEVVEALHKAVTQSGAEMCQRYYKLLATELGLEKLAWSDRNAKLPKENSVFHWDEAVSIVRSAYRSFSPTLADLVDTIFERGWIDAPHYRGKSGGAFNMSLALPGEPRAQSYTFLNYLGSPRDVSTLAHELGHAVHGLLSAEVQGALMYNAPIAYCETASIFGEMVTFEFLKQRSENDQARLRLLMEKSNDFVNSVVRQTSFSLFEQRLHQARKQGKLTTDTLCNSWIEATEVLYGKNGELFELRDMNNLWAYVSHFTRPFYVYGYAFGELLTQSLYSQKDAFGDKFEPLYLELLRAGGTKDAIELLKPFGLDPRDPEFWKRGIEGSIGKWLDEAEKISAKLRIMDPLQDQAATTHSPEQHPLT